MEPLLAEKVCDDIAHVGRYGKLTQGIQEAIDSADIKSCRPIQSQEFIFPPPLGEACLNSPRGYADGFLCAALASESLV